MVKDEPIGPRFFRLLMPGFATKLPIPHAFMKHVMKDKNREKATLVNSAGKTWHVDLCNISGDVCFGGEGWEEFVHTHNLSFGYMLVFRYRGNMVFRFRVYGLNSCEELRVRYNRKPANESSNNMAHGEEQSYDSNPKTRRHAHNKKTVKTKTSLEHISEHPNRKSSSSDMRKISKDQNTSKTKGRYAKKVQFKATISATSLTGAYMTIPARFKKNAGISVDDKEVYLSDPKAKTWLLGLYHRSDFSKSFIMKGWQAFVRANQLKKGDNYIFELISRKKGVMHIEMRKL